MRRPRQKAWETLEAAKEKIASNYDAAKQKSREVKDGLTGRGRDEDL